MNKLHWSKQLTAALGGPNAPPFPSLQLWQFPATFDDFIGIADGWLMHLAFGILPPV